MNMYERFELEGISLDEGMLRRSKLSRLATEILWLHTIDLEESEKQIQLKRLKILVFLIVSEIFDNLGNVYNKELWQDYDKLCISIKNLESEIIN